MKGIDRARLGLAQSKPLFDSVAAVADELTLERMRQVDGEGFDLAHDDAYRYGELSKAAMAYCQTATVGVENTARFDRPPSYWPWDIQRWKPKDRRRDLVRAGALIIAEIQRLDRAAAKASPPYDHSVEPQQEYLGVRMPPLDSDR